MSSNGISFLEEQEFSEDEREDFDIYDFTEEDPTFDGPIVGGGEEILARKIIRDSVQMIQQPINVSQPLAITCASNFLIYHLLLPIIVVIIDQYLTMLALHSMSSTWKK